MILHGLWSIKEEGLIDGRFFLWAERLKPHGEDRGGDKTTNTHPYALSGEELLGNLKIKGSPKEYILSLPSDKSLPIHSSYCIQEGKGIGGDPILKEWITPGIEVSPDDIIDFLIQIDEDTLRAERILLGQDIIFWSQVARFGIDLACKQRFLPWLSYTKERNLGCYWQPVFINEEEKNIFSHLQSSIPDSARCAFQKNPPSPQRIILHFLTFFINHLIRNSGVSVKSSGRDYARPASNGTGYDLREFFTEKEYLGPEDNIQKEKFWCGDILEVPRKDIIYNQFNEWVSSLKIRPQERGFRTCFRLQAPGT